MSSSSASASPVSVHPSPAALGAFSSGGSGSSSASTSPPSASSSAFSSPSAVLPSPLPPPHSGGGHLKAVAFSLYPPSPSTSTSAAGHLLNRPSTGLSSTASTDVETEPSVMDSPLSVDASTCCSSAASSRAPSPSLHPLAPHTSPAQSSKAVEGKVSQAGPPPLALHSPTVSPATQPLSPASPSNSSDSLSSTSSSSSASSFTYGKEASARAERLSQRGKRVPLSQTQKAVLEESFLLNHYPTREEKTALGARIHLSGDKVHKWYDNRRTKLNKEGKGKPRGAEVLLSHTQALYDEATGGLRLHPYSLPMKPRSPLMGMGAPMMPLQPQQLQMQQLQQLQHQQQQQQQHMHNAQLQQLQLLQSSQFQHPFLHPPQLLSGHQQQQMQQLQQQQQQQDALLRQMSLNSADPRLALLPSSSQMGFLQSASVSPALQLTQSMPAQSMLGLGGVLTPKPTTPPGASSSAFHAVGQASTSSPVVLSRSSGSLPLPSSAVPASSLQPDNPSSYLLTSPSHPTSQLPSLAFRSLSAHDVPSFNAAFAQPSTAAFASLPADAAPGAGLPSPPTASPLFTCTPTATGFSLYRPFPTASLK